MQQALSRAETLDDFFGKEGIFARLFSETVESLIAAESTEHLSNSRKGSYPTSLRTEAGDTTVQVSRDRQGDFELRLLQRRDLLSPLKRVRLLTTACCRRLRPPQPATLAPQRSIRAHECYGPHSRPDQLLTHNHSDERAHSNL